MTTNCGEGGHEASGSGFGSGSGTGFPFLLCLRTAAAAAAPPGFAPAPNLFRAWPKTVSASRRTSVLDSWEGRREQRSQEVPTTAVNEIQDVDVAGCPRSSSMFEDPLFVPVPSALQWLEKPKMYVLAAQPHS